MRRILNPSLAILVALVACSPAEGPESIAQRFVEQYYVHPDLPKVKALTYGLAHHKIEEEQRLIQSVAGRVGRAEREVTYNLHQTQKMGEDKIFFVYDITISVDPLVMRKRATVATGRVKGGWRVTNFEESDI
ncbi:MAG: hypothetical protein ACE5JQ_04330 [Candidatus Methylomirabilales bacterium]